MAKRKVGKMRQDIIRIKRREADGSVCLSCIKIEIVSHQNTCLVCTLIIKTQRGFQWLHLQYLCQAGIFFFLSIFFPSSIDKRVWWEGAFSHYFSWAVSIALRKKNAVNITNQISYWVCDSTGRRDRKQNCTELEIVADGFPASQN